MNPNSRVSQSPTDAAHAVSVQETLRLFEMSVFRRPGKARVLWVALAAVLNACTYLEGFTIIPRFLKLPVQLDTSTNFLITSCLFHFYCGFLGSMNLKLGISGRLTEFFIDADTIAAGAADWPALAAGMSESLTRCRQVMRRILAAFLISAGGNSISVVLILFLIPNQPPLSFSNRLLLFGNGPDETLPTIGRAPWPQVLWESVAALIWVYKIFMWIFGFVTLYALVYMLTCLLSGFNSGISSQVRNSQGLSMESAAAFRMFYLKLVEMVRSADRILRLFTGATFLFCLAVSMFTVNTLLDVVYASPFASMVVLFWIISCVVMLLLCVYICGRVCNLLKKPLEVIHRQEVTAKNSTEISMLLHAVSHTDCGISCFNLFIIDYYLVVSLAGVFLTYFILIMQIRAGAGTTTCICNGTQPAA